MADLIKKVKIKKQDETYTDYIPIGAEANNVDCADGESVEYKLNKKPYYYNCVADMKTDTKLKAGDMAVTLGYYEPNDGGSAEYKIISGDFTEDNMKLYKINKKIFAQLIVKNEINVKQCGAYGNGVHDDTSIIQKIIDTNPHKSIFFSKGTYLISSHIDLPANNNKTVSLFLDKYAVIKASEKYDDDLPMLCLGGKDYDDYYLYENFADYGIKGGTLDCNRITGGISIQNAVQSYVKDIKINRCAKTGIDVVNGSNNNSADVFVDNVIIICSNNTEAIAIKVSAADNLFSNIRTFSGKYGFYITGGGNHFENIHSLATSRDLNEYYQDMVAFYVKGNYNYFTFPYSDQYATGFYIDGLRRTMVKDYYCYYWKDDDTHQHTAIQCSARMTGRFNNVHCRFPAGGTNTILKLANRTLCDGFIKTLTIHNIANLNDVNDLGYNPLFNKDPLLLDSTKLTNVISNLTFHYNEITACNNIINYNAIISGIEIPASTNTVLFKLPEGFYNPNNNININAKLVNSDSYQKIICYISTSGSVIINTPVAINNSQIQLFGSALNTQFI